MHFGFVGRSPFYIIWKVKQPFTWHVLAECSSAHSSPLSMPIRPKSYWLIRRSSVISRIFIWNVSNRRHIGHREHMHVHLYGRLSAQIWEWPNWLKTHLTMVSYIYIYTLRCNLSSQTLNQLQKTTRRWQDKDEKHILHVRPCIHNALHDYFLTL